MAEANLRKFAYQTLQQGKGLVGLAHKEVSTKLMELLVPDAIPQTKPVTTDLLLQLKESIKQLEEIDWLDAENGIYPKNLLFEAPWFQWLLKYPLVWLDMPFTWNRRKAKRFQDLPKGVNKEMYPKYYLQNFHGQTDGYLSDYSAGIYDIQVEILFNGTADAMRRRVISPLKVGLKNGFKTKDSSSYKILDIATGTGRTLKQLSYAFPKSELIGIDLSGSYLKQASKYLNNSQRDMVQLIKGNAEKIPLLNETFNGITCVFLFHELPGEARENVIKECFRLLKPNGTLVLADSIQINDSPQFTEVMENFYKAFHEPYYKDYLKDDINERLVNTGFTDIKAQSFFMTRVWSANKPSSNN